MRYIKRLLPILLCLTLMLQPVQASAHWDAEAQMLRTAEGLYSLSGKPGQLLSDPEAFPPGTSACDWSAMALALSGQEGDYEAYLKGLKAYVEEAYARDGGLDRVKSTPYHRIALTVMALGGDPTAFGEKPDGTAINLIEDGIWSFSGNIGAQGLNGWIYALLTLDAWGREVPEGAAVTRQDMVQAIVSAQEPEGGFGLAAGAPDVDITAMALQALAPYASEHSGAINAALAWLSGQMTDDGTFRSYGDDSAESSAQVLLALCALGIDPEEDIRFRKGVETVLTGIDRFRCGDGTYSHLRDEQRGDYLASAQMLLAITALNRLRSGNSWIFDYTGYTGPAQAGPGLLLPLSASAAIVLTAIILIVRKRRNHGKKNG